MESFIGIIRRFVADADWAVSAVMSSDLGLFVVSGRPGDTPPGVYRATPG